MTQALPFLSLLFVGAPAAASTAIPEPSSFALFALGVLGVIVGRRGSRRRDDD